jgi:hypothetical protein
VVHAYNPSYSGGSNQEECGSKPARQKVSKTLSSTNKPGVVVYACHPSYTEGIDKRIAVVYGWHKQKCKTLPEK